MSGSGYAAEAVARQNLMRGSQDYENYLNRLSGTSQMGLNAASGAAGVAQNRSSLSANRGQAGASIYGQQSANRINRGNALADLKYGLNQQLAGQRIGLGNSLAETRGIGWNNLMGLASTAAKAYGAGA